MSNKKEQDLPAEFVQYYEELDRHYKEGQYAGQENTADCYVTFGITGAGKSTTIARLLSGLDPIAFQKELLQKRQFVVIEEVTIGHTAASTTVVPKIYSVGDFHVCDMPGFSDIDLNKRILIDMLTKCFVTRIRRPKYLIVVDINEIDSLNGVEKATTIVDHYVKPLCEMLGNRYSEFLMQAHFVLTKNDNNQARQDGLPLLLKKLSVAVGTVNPDAGIFLKRMALVHTVLNMDESREQTRVRIQSMIENAKNSATALTQNAPFNLDFLAGGENRLLGISEEAIDTMKTSVDDLMANAMSLQTAVCTYDQNARSHAQDIVASFSALKNEVSKICEEEAALEAQIGNAHSSVQQVAHAISDAKTSRDFHADLLKNTLSIFARHKTVWMRSDVAQVVMSGKATRYTVDITASTRDIPDYNALIAVTFEDDDATLKKYFHGSPVPTTLDALSAVKGDTVLYNSRNTSSPGRIADPKITMGSDSVKVFAEHSQKFKLYAFSEESYTNSAEYTALVTEFRRRLVIAEENLAKAKERQVSELTAQEKHRARLEELRVLKLTKNAELACNKDHVTAQIKNMQGGYRASHDSLKALRAGLAATTADPMIDQIAKIAAILDRNNITSQLDIRRGQLLAKFPAANIFLEQLGIIIDSMIANIGQSATLIQI